MSTQKAVVIHEVGKPVVLVPDRAVPQPGPDQLQVKVTVTALNPHDQKSRDWGLLAQDNLPWICASDVVGTISALGSNATKRYSMGNRIMLFTLQLVVPHCAQAGLQQYALTDIGGMSCKIPDALSDDQAATIPTNLTTAFVALFVTLGIRVPWEADGEVPGVLLVVGGGSNCGKFVVQLAKLAGIETIIAIGGKESELKGLGATHVLDRHAGVVKIVKEVKAITDDGLAFALDAVNMPEGLALGFDALSSKQRGKLARLVPAGQVGEDVTKGHECLDVFAGRMAKDARVVEMWERLPEWIEKGDVRPLVYAFAGGLTAEAVNEALDKYRDGRSEGQPHIHVA